MNVTAQRLYIYWYIYIFPISRCSNKGKIINVYIELMKIVLWVPSSLIWISVLRLKIHLISETTYQRGKKKKEKKKKKAQIDQNWNLPGKIEIRVLDSYLWIILYFILFYFDDWSLLFSSENSNNSPGSYRMVRNIINNNKKKKSKEKEVKSKKKKSYQTNKSHPRW